MQKHSQYNSQRTYRFDCLRGGFQGVIDAGWMTFVVLIAIRCFNASNMVKACIVSSGFWGYFLNPLVLSVAIKSRLKTSQLAFLYYILSAFLIAICAFVRYLWLYAVLIILWQFLSCQVGPVMTQVYAENYDKTKRGQYCSTTFLIASTVGSIFSYFGGRFLDLHLNYYTAILLGIALSSVFAAFCVYKIPSKPLNIQKSGDILKNLSLLWKDKLFGWISLGWTLMSLAQWMIMPLRVEYMANPVYQWCATNRQIAITTFVIPAISQIISLKLWGYIFDKLNFMIMRILINACVIAGVLTFFYTNTLFLLGLGTALIGFGSGGGILTTNIWVTKIAPKESVASYTSAHVWVSGLRGLLAPFLGFLFLEKTDPTTVACFVCIMGCVSTGMFLKVKKHKRMQA